jgi:hypothetical protein
MTDEYNDGYTHEALHTTWVLTETFSRHVAESRCCDEFEDVSKLAQRVENLMNDLYQLIGSKLAVDPS